MNYSEYCQQCLYYSWNLRTGIICRLTNNKPNFMEKCESFKLELDHTKIKQFEKKTKLPRWNKNPYKTGMVIGLLSFSLLFFSYFRLGSDPFGYFFMFFVGSVVSLLLGGFIQGLLIDFSELPKGGIAAKTDLKKPSLLKVNIMGSLFWSIAGLFIIIVFLLFFSQNIAGILLGLIIGGVLIIYGISESLREYFQGSDKLLTPDGWIEFSCPLCKNQINLEHIPEGYNELFNCPYCKELISTPSK